MNIKEVYEIALGKLETDLSTAKYYEQYNLTPESHMCSVETLEEKIKFVENLIENLK